MPRKFTTPVELPADAALALHAVPKQQLDNAITTHAHLLAMSTKTVNYTALDTDSIILMDTTSANKAVTLPTPIGRAGKSFTVKKTVAANRLDLTTTVGTIDGLTTVSIWAIYSYLQVVSDGANWFIIDSDGAPSAKNYFCDVYSQGLPGGSTKQTILNATWTTVTLDTKVTDTTNSFNTTTSFYTVPVTGVYLCTGNIRPNDSQVVKATFPDGTGIGLGIGLSTDVDGTWVMWNKWMWMSGTGGSRVSFPYIRIAAFTAGQVLRLYAFSDCGAQFNVTSAAMQIWRIG
jgi:hypothetical protein